MKLEFEAFADRVHNDTCYNSCNYVCSSYFHYWFSICKKLMLEYLLKKNVRWLCITSKMHIQFYWCKMAKKSMKSYMNFTTSVCADHEPIFLCGGRFTQNVGKYAD
jgi:hypothetical protein